jgi:hypothetical protein
MMVVDVATQPSFRAGRPRLLFEGRFNRVSLHPGHPNFDVSADGQRFLMIRGEQDPAPTQVNLELDWTEELKRKTATGASR